MRLRSLRMRNFRQHADTEIQFRGGLTGIIGPNGAGKSTILEAIAWAIYGSSAARGTNDTIRFARAGARSRVEVDLSFALGPHELRVVRTLNSAEVYLDGGLQPVAATLGGASTYLQARVGMTREEFFNTYFTGQKELQFLATMGPADRGRFLSQVLGYERLRRAQDLARARRNELRHEIKGLRAALGDPEEIAAARRAAERRMSESLTALSAAETAAALAAEEMRAHVPLWEAAQGARERHRELTRALEIAAQERDTAQRDFLKSTAELEGLEKAEAELAPLRVRLEALPGVTAEAERLEELARAEARRGALEAGLRDIDAEVKRLEAEVARRDTAPDLERRYAEELAAVRAERDAAQAEQEEARTVWLRDRQDAQTKLQGYRDRAAELKEQIQQIRTLGPEGACPTCGRPVGDDFERLLDEMEEQWVSLVQDGKWWKSRADQLDQKPEELVSLERRLSELGAQAEEKSRRHTRCEEAVKELGRLREERDGRRARRAAVEAERAALPVGYDAARHAEVEVELKTLRGVGTRAAGLEAAVARRGAVERDRQDALIRQQNASERAAAHEGERTALAFSEERFAAVRAEHDAARERQVAAGLRAASARGEVGMAEQALQSARAAQAEYDERARTVAERETDLKYHDELDLALSELRAELNAAVRPELSEIASTFLAQLTDGRYTSMEIDEAYNLMVLDEGEEKPVISGGEEDVANLVLRLSLSQMIAERAGHPLSLLILDEVFGSLDVARRDNVVSLLHHLEDRFEQVILITHVEGIREGLDQVLRVDFDERTGTSVVREERPPGEEPDEPGLAAD